MNEITNIINFAKKLTIKKIVNSIQVISSYAIALILRKPIRWGMPLSISMEPTNYCNLRCPQCPTGINRLSRPKGYMDLRTFKKVIDQSSPYLLNLFLYFQGEPFLNKRLPDFISYANEKKIYTALSTNGNIWSEKIISETINAGLDKIIISMDGADQTTYEQYRRGGNLSRVIKLIKFISTYKKQHKLSSPIIEVQILLTKHTENQKETIKEIAKNLGADIVNFKTIQICDFSSASDFLPTNPKFSRYKRINDKWIIKRKIRNRCWRLWNSVVFTWDGTAVPCCYDKDAKYPLGNIQHQSIKEIIRGTNFKTFANKVLTNQKQIDICRNCWG